VTAFLLLHQVGPNSINTVKLGHIFAILFALLGFEEFVFPISAGLLTEQIVSVCIFVMPDLLIFRQWFVRWGIHQVGFCCAIF
jgi:hypothetical protein